MHNNISSVLNYDTLIFAFRIVFRYGEKMKITCKCGGEGFLEKRGNSYRVKHYLRKLGKKRIYKTCKLTALEAQVLGIDGNQPKTKTPNFAIFRQNRGNSGLPLLAVNQSVIGSNPIGGATPSTLLY
jgi:hypothetical protein